MKKFFSPAVLSILSLTAIVIAQSIFLDSATLRVKRMAAAAAQAQEMAAKSQTLSKISLKQRDEMAYEAAKAREMSIKSLALSQMLLKQRDEREDKIAKIIFIMTIYGYSQGQQRVPMELFLTNAAQMVGELNSATNLDFTIELQYRSLTNDAHVKKWL
jgi:hypothetical protein